MLFAYTYPILDIFWSIFLFFLFFLWIWLLVVIFMDIFRSPDLSGFGKAAWFIFVLVIPLIGVLVYLIAGSQDAGTRGQRRQGAGRGIPPVRATGPGGRFIDRSAGQTGRAP